MMSEMAFRNPEFLWLLAVLPLLILLYKYRVFGRRPKVIHSATDLMQNRGWRTRWVHMPFACQLLGFGLCVLALARPQSRSERVDTIDQSGIDIVIAMDISTSMKALDFKPNRLEAAKDIAIDFVSGRVTDRVGIVVYAAESYTQCPITSDYKIVNNLLSEVDFGFLDDGTAIGMGLATAVSRLKDSEADSKVVILLSDGANNSGTISPTTAADLAVEFGVKVYTIAIGKPGKVPYPTNVGVRMVDSQVDDNLLKEIANTTGAQYFRADNNEKLKQIYEEIDKLERTKISELRYASLAEHYRPFLILGLILLCLQRILQLTLFKSIA